MLVALLETGARLWYLSDPQLFTRPLPEEEGGLFVDDALLFWRLAPNLDLDYRGNRVRTNRDGLRSPPVPERHPSEFRILSLGESTTFGTGVEDHETYSARLEDLLAASQTSRSYRVLNAGTPAHSSYQFQAYLRNHGFEHQPDLVLLYSEVNDYLPASLRDSSNNEIGVSLSDAELAVARGSTIQRWLETHSAFFGALRFARARNQLAQFHAGSAKFPMRDIGLPSIGLKPRLFEREAGSTGLTRSKIREGQLPPRVRSQERRDHLHAIANACEAQDVALLVIHPAYRDTRPHDCELTRFVETRGVAMLDAYPVLHPSDVEAGALYRDLFHPNREGHERLSQALAQRVLADFAAPTF